MLSFNSYAEGLVTLFNLMVVNDWNMICLVFTSPSVGPEWLAYLYFIVVNLFVVGVMLNVIQGFFVEGFMKVYAGAEPDAPPARKVSPETVGEEAMPLLVLDRAEDCIDSPSPKPPIVVTYNPSSSTPSQTLKWSATFSLACGGAPPAKVARALLAEVSRGANEVKFFEVGVRYKAYAVDVAQRLHVIVLTEKG